MGKYDVNNAKMNTNQESSQPGDLSEDLPSLTSQPGKIPEFDILTLSMVTDIIVMTTGDVTSAQAEELIIDIGVKDILVEASREKALTVELVPKVATKEAITVPDTEAPVVN